ncbi:ribosomal protein S18-alanine N-acetyltransferase [Candidatus Bathyarchaeota archaeon]|nr:ribosomal protein S18-alanine N-acetyltransferase [Candidatus Bathyarchaeota archaeon]
MASITRFKPQHLGQVCEIENSSFSEPFSADYFEQLAEKYPETFLISEKESRVLGYIVAETYRNKAHILSIAVRDDCRRKRIGSGLLDALIERLRLKEVKEVFLEVRESNVAARSLYEKAGFKLSGRIKGYYGKDDAVLYHLKL